MNFSIIFTILVNIATANYSFGVLTNSRFGRIVRLVRNNRQRMLMKTTYLQCASGRFSPNGKTCQDLVRFVLAAEKRFKRYYKH